MVAAYMLGARKGRFREIDGRHVVADFPGHSMALKTLGVLILWFGYVDNCWILLSLNFSSFHSFVVLIV